MSIKSEIEGQAIVLVPGVYSKIELELSSKGEIDFTNTDSFTIGVDDDVIELLNGQIKVTPTESLVYDAYIGIKCGSSFTGSKKELRFKILSFDGSGAGIDYPILEVEIKKMKTKIDLDVLMDEIPGSSYDLFKLAKDIRNIEELKILPQFIGDEKLLEFTEMVLKPFGQREEFSEDNVYNHGVLFDFPFGTKKTFEELKNKASLAFNLNLDTEGVGQCFEFVKSNFELNVKNEGPVTLDARVKQAIVYNTDNGSPKFDMSNNIQINTVIPIAPVLLSCEVRIDSTFSNNEDTLTSTEEEGVFHYKTFIEKSGQVSVKLDGLSSDTEYYTKCTISNTNFVENLREKIAVTIGNFDGADIIRQLLPSRNQNRVPQCLKLKFSDYALAVILEKILPKYCKWVMTKNEPLLARVLGTVVCQLTETASLLNPVSTICIAPSPLYNINKFLKKSQEDTYNENIEQFINDIKNVGTKFFTYGLKNLKVEVVNRYYDTDEIDINNIALTLESTSIDKAFTFSVVSSHPQPLECYYNPILTSERTRFLQLYEQKIVLNPNEKKTINARLVALTSGLYSLYFKCYNLPGFLYKFESSDKEVMYTYSFDLSSLIIGKQDVPANKPVTINCDEIRNLKNPRCMKKKVLFLVEQLKTEIPAVISEIQAKAEKFTQVAKDNKKKILDKLQTELTKALSYKDKVKEWLEKAIEMAKYLTYTDCSIYVSGSTNEEEETVKAGAYVECRKSKKEYLKTLITFLQQNFKCTELLSTLIATSTTDMTIEERMKYILLLINEITNNPDALEESTSKFLNEMVDCLKNEFETYWAKVETYLQNEKNYLKETVAAVKRDAESIILQTLTNLVNVLHFEEIDGYLDKVDKEIQDTGMMVYNKGLELQNKIIEFGKKLIEFGNQTYQLGLNAAAQVIVNNGVSASADAEVTILDLQNKGIKVIANANFMMRDYKASAMQTLVFESPLFSVKANGIEEGDPESLNTFVSITLYDKDGKEITVEDVKEQFRPQILYLKSRYEQLKTCFYFDEEDNELENGGLEVDEEFTYQGVKYFRCLSEHLTSFTAGTEMGGLKWYHVLLIIFGVIVVLAGLGIGFIILRKRLTNNAFTNATINKNFSKEDPLVS